MNETDFIKNKLERLANTFTQLTFRYAYYNKNSMHVIEVTPVEEYENNEEYKIAEGDLVFEFNEKYINSDIVFVSENSLVQLDRVDFEVCKLPNESYLLDELNNNELSINEIMSFLWESDMVKFDMSLENSSTDVLENKQKFTFTDFDDPQFPLAA